MDGALTMPRHARGELEPQRPPARPGTQSRSDRGRAAGREPARGGDDERESHPPERVAAPKRKRLG